jgi:hypothetical protein
MPPVGGTLPAPTVTAIQPKGTKVYTPTEHNPVVETVGDVAYRLYDLTYLMAFGMTRREAAETRHMRDHGDYEEYGTALRIIRGYAAGIARDEFAAALDLDGFDTYVTLRRDGANHDEALVTAAAVHRHRFGKGEVLSDFCPVLRTGTRTVRHSCACGHQETISERRNYSGD